VHPVWQPVNRSRIERGLLVRYTDDTDFTELHGKASKISMRIRPSDSPKGLFIETGMIYFSHANRIYRYSPLLARTRAVFLRGRARGSQPRDQVDLQPRDVWLGYDPRPRADRPHRVRDLPVPQGRPLPAAPQGRRAQGGESGGERRGHSADGGELKSHILKVKIYLCCL